MVQSTAAPLWGSVVRLTTHLRGIPPLMMDASCVGGWREGGKECLTFVVDALALMGLSLLVAGRGMVD